MSHMAPAPLLLRSLPLLRIRLHHRLAAVALLPSRRPWCVTTTAVAFSTELEGRASSVDDNSTVLLSTQEPPKFHRWDDPDYRKWKDKEEEILRDIEPIISLAKEILHSNRYLDGESLTDEHEVVVVEKLLAYHPHSHDKIGCGLDCIMVDRHPQFRRSRCLFVVRTDGGWIDFSYQKCIRAYIRAKYPSYAERFIKEYFKRGSG